MWVLWGDRTPRLLFWNAVAVAAPRRWADGLRRITGGWLVLGCIKAGAAAAAHTSKALLLLHLHHLLLHHLLLTAAPTDGRSSGWWSHFFVLRTAGSVSGSYITGHTADFIPAVHGKQRAAALVLCLCGRRRTYKGKYMVVSRWGPCVLWTSRDLLLTSFNSHLILCNYIFLSLVVRISLKPANGDLCDIHIHVF